MITTKEAKSELSRMSGLSYFPSEPSAAKELLLALEKANNLEIAHAVVSQWVEEYSECPKPSHLHAMISSANIRSQERLDRPACAECNGTGFVIVEVGAYSGAKPCDACDTLPATHHSRPGTQGHREKEGGYWKPSWRRDSRI